MAGLTAQGAEGGDVAPSAEHRDRVDIGGVKLDAGDDRGQGHPQSARTAAEVEHHRAGPGERRCLVHQKFGATAGNEDAGVHLDASAEEVDPTEDGFKRQARDSSVDHLGELGGCCRLGEEQACLVFGEDASGCSEPSDDR